MKTKLILAAAGLTIASCTKDKVTNNVEDAKQSVSNGVENVKQGITPAASQNGVNKLFVDPLKYVDLDGQYVALNDMSREVAMIDNLLEKVADFNDDPELQKLLESRFANVLRLSGFNHLKSSAVSTKHVGDGWVNKQFYDLDGFNKGVFTLFKGRGKEWAVYDYAPSGTDIALEFDLNVEQLQGLFDEFVGLLPKDERKEVQRQMFGVKNNPLMQKIMADGLHTRASVIIKLDDEKTIEPEKGVKVPNIDAAVRVEGMVWLFDKYKEMIAQTSKVETKNGLTYYTPPSELPVPFLQDAPLSPVVVVDSKNDYIWISAREPFLDDCLDGSAKLKDDAEFKSLMSHLSNSGNFYGFLSQDLFQRAQGLIQGSVGQKLRQEAKSNASSAQDLKIANALLDFMEKDVFGALVKSEGGFAMTMDLNTDGILFSSKTPMPLKQQGLYGKISMVSALAAISSPIIIRQIARSRGTQAINNGKDIYIGLREYAFENGGKIPNAGEGKSANEHFRILFDKNKMYDESPFYIQGVDGAFEPDELIGEGDTLDFGENVFGYFPGANIIRDSANRPVLIAPFTSKDGKLELDEKAFGNQCVIVTVDGAAYALDIQDGKAVDYDGRVMFENGTGYYYDGDEKKEVKVTYPEL